MIDNNMAETQSTQREFVRLSQLQASLVNREGSVCLCVYKNTCGSMRLYSFV